MEKIYISLLAVALVGVQACAPVDPEPDFTHIEGCAAYEMQGLVGQHLSLANLSQLARPLRVIHPGMPVTMDYLIDRINIDVDAQDVITRIWCG